MDAFLAFSFLPFHDVFNVGTPELLNGLQKRRQSNGMGERKR